MKDNFWTYAFGAIGAVAGLAYLWTTRNAQPAQSVTNVFPPLNTDSPTPSGSASVDSQLPTSQPQMTMPTTPTPNGNVYPVYVV